MAGPEFPHFRPLLPAVRRGHWTARMEYAAGRGIDRAWHLALDGTEYALRLD
jgi:hypothetical protein